MASAQPAPTERPELDALQAGLTLLPAIVLALPGPFSVLAGVPSAVSAGTGWTALAALPAAALLAFRGGNVRVRGLALFLVPLGLAVLRATTVPDTFGATRALLGLATALVLLLSGASLAETGRALLVRGAAALSLVWVLDASFDGERGFAGALENTGDLSEAALPGALVGLVLLAFPTGSARLLGGAAALAYLVYAGLLGPVYAGLVSFAAASVLGLLATGHPRPGADPERPTHRRLAFTLALAIIAILAARPGLELLSTPTDEIAEGVEEARATTGGFRFRALTWRRVPGLVGDHAWIGAGPGQFEAAFPPHRDPAEIALSTQGHDAPFSTAVEHAHNDWLEGFAEYGLVGGACWVAFLLLVAAAATRAVRGGDFIDGALGIAAVGVLANALFNSPLLAGPAASALAFPIFGTLLGARFAGRTKRARAHALLPWAAGLLLAVHAPRALDLVAHGRALADLSGSALFDTGERIVHRAKDKQRVVARALAACPDSTIALTERAHLLRTLDAPAEEQLEAWERVLARQPQRFEALLSIANILARERHFARARELYDRTEALDPAHPGLLRNRVLLALAEGREENVSNALDGWAERGALDDEWLERSAAEQLLRGRPHLAGLLLRRAGATYAFATGEEAYALSKSLAEEKPLLADGMAALAHQLWAQGHADDDRQEDAVRSYRQSLRISRDYGDAPELAGGARLVRLELAAALLRAGRVDEARATVAGLEPTPTELVELSTWAGQELLDAGLILR